jgi:TRAP transporter TAXI family solute receptor
VTLRARIAAAALAAAALAAFHAHGQDIKLPPTITLTAYDTGSSGFNIAVAIGKAIKDKHGTDVRVLPAGNDVARLQPLKGGRAQASAMGIGVYFAQEGVFEFAVKEWGPQPLGLMLASSACNAISLGVAKDVGAKQISDLKGKRVAVVVGAPSLNQNALAVLAFGGLTRNDVKLVEFSSYGAAWKGMVNNEVDAAIASTISGQAKEAEASPRGLVYPPTPAADKAGWARLHKFGPYYAPHKATCGVGATPQNPIELPNYPYPIFVAYASQSADIVHGFTKAMMVNYAAYKDGAPGADGFELARQNFAWVLPLHPGAVRAVKEAGAWKAEHEANQQMLVKRQGVLAAAWNAYLKTNPAEDRDAFRKGWMVARADALKKAGMEAIFE